MLIGFSMDQNPYESPREQKPPRDTVDVEKIRRQNKTAAIVILALVSVPSTFIAFFVVCNATVTIGDPTPTLSEEATPFVAAAFVAAIFIFAIYATSKWYRGG
jgi:hypothetical protein